MSTHFLRDDSDKPQEKCGIFGIYGHESAAELTKLGLFALQHRGQEASGIVTYDGNGFHIHRGMGLVGQVFDSAATMESLKGSVAIGHNRYPTTGKPDRENIQPLHERVASGDFAVAHNGNLTNAMTLRDALAKSGAVFRSTTDTEVIPHLFARSAKDGVIDRLSDAFNKLEGAYSLVILTDGALFGVRDPNGIRPLVLGKLGEAYVLASETCALDIIGAEYVRDIEAGELVKIDKRGIESFKPFSKTPQRFCVFELIYFARPDSYIAGRSVYETRKRIGAELAKEAPCAGADCVIPVPDSGRAAAVGYAQQSGIPYEEGMTRNQYVGRTFIQPTDELRHLGVRMKHNANWGFLKGKKIVLVDDSIVRGTTSKKIVAMLRDAGAKEIHMRISSPPPTNPCHLGINTPTQDELISHRMRPNEIRKYIGADSLAYISIDALYRAVNGAEGRNGEHRKFCDACFTGEYPVALTDLKR
jgi:amidophosphoribosyltransferase